MGAADYTIGVAWFIASILVGAAFFMMGPTPEDFMYARYAFVAAGLIFGATGLIWGFTASASPLLLRAVIVGFMSAIAFAATIEFVNLTLVRETDERQQIVNDALRSTTVDTRNWLDRMLIGARPVGMPDTLWQPLERAGIVERDYTGLKGIVPGFAPAIKKWLQEHPGVGRSTTTAQILTTKTEPVATLSMVITKASPASPRPVVNPTPSLVHPPSANMPGESYDSHSHLEPHARSKFVIPLRAFYAEGGEIIRFVAGANTDQELDKRQERLWGWLNRIGLWTCKNMGESAMTKAIPLTLDAYTTNLRPTPEATQLSARKEALMSMVSVVQERLSSLIERDIWDPIGDPVLPKEGCETVVGKVTDPPAKF